MRRDGEFLPVGVMIARDMNSDSPPHVMYKDRQHLLERVDRGIQLPEFKALRSGYDVPVILINADPDKSSVVSAWQTTAREWLPMPFTPANLGPDFNNSLRHYDEAKKKLFG